MPDPLHRTRYPSRRSERGQALLLLLVLLGMATGIFAFSMAGDVSRAAERANTEALVLAEARAALIGWAASRGDTVGNERPGELPCPDTKLPTDLNYGTEDGTCTGGKLGRIPWKTLGIAEPKDGYGETLWYAVAGPFRKFSLSSSAITSNTMGNMTVYSGSTATTLTTQAIAVIFAPGAALGSQQRDTASAACATTGTTIARNLCAANYLESTGGANNAVNNGPFISVAASTSDFNDRVIFIAAEDLMPVVEKRVAREMIAILTQYKAVTGVYPWADLSDGNSNASGSDYYNHWRMPCGTALPTDWGSGGVPALPPWLTNGCGSTGWTHVIYYAVSRLELQIPGQCSTCTDNRLSVDGNTVNLVLITPGGYTGSPTRSWSNSSFTTISGYFEDSANRNNNDSFVTPSKALYPHATNHDRIFTIQ